MAIGRTIGRVLGAVPRAVGSVGRAIAEEVAPQPVAAAPVLAPVAAAAAEPEEFQFQLPEIAEDDPDREEKLAIHEAYSKLEKMLTDSAAADNIDIRGKHRELADFVRSRPEPRRWSPLAGFAIAAGAPGAINKVADDNRRADEAQRQRDEDLLAIQEAAIKGEISQAMEKKNFRKALTQSKLLADLDATRKRIQDMRDSKNKIEEIKAANEGKVEVARIKAASALATVQERARSLAERYNLDAITAKAMYQMATNMVSNFQRQTDAAGEPYYDREQIQAVLNTMVDFAEDHMDERKTPAAGATPPAKTQAPAAGPKSNDAVRAAFEARRKARAEAQTK